MAWSFNSFSPGLSPILVYINTIVFSKKIIKNKKLEKSLPTSYRINNWVSRRCSSAWPGGRLASTPTIFTFVSLLILITSISFVNKPRSWSFITANKIFALICSFYRIKYFYTCHKSVPLYPTAGGPKNN